MYKLLPLLLLIACKKDTKVFVGSCLAADETYCVNQFYNSNDYVLTQDAAKYLCDEELHGRFSTTQKCTEESAAGSCTNNYESSVTQDYFFYYLPVRVIKDVCRKNNLKINWTKE